MACERVAISSVACENYHLVVSRTLVAFAERFPQNGGTMAEDWARLAQAVQSRRQHLRLSQLDVQAAGGPSDVVLSRIERNETPHPRGNTLQKLDVGLQWRAGSAVAVLDGGDPVCVEAPLYANSIEDRSTEELLDTISEASAELQRRKGWFNPNPDAPMI